MPTTAMRKLIKESFRKNGYTKEHYLIVNQEEFRKALLLIVKSIEENKDK